jgi:predicted ester cyclase
VDIATAKQRQKPGTDYGDLKSLVTRNASERRSDAQLTAEEKTNLETYLKYKTVQPHERAQFHAPGFQIHRRGFIHLSDMLGFAGKELDHSALEGRFDEIEDVIVKGDRLWSVFTLRAKHVGTLYGVPATGKEVAITEMCVIRFENGKIAESWWFGDELSICRQLGIPIGVGSV